MERQPLTILVDADACPVKDEVYRVADRHRAQVFVVSNAAFRIPDSPLVRQRSQWSVGIAVSWVLASSDQRVSVNEE